MRRDILYLKSLVPIYRDRSANQIDKPRLIHKLPDKQKLRHLMTVVQATTFTLARQWLLSSSTNHLLSYFPFLIFETRILIHKWNSQFAGSSKLCIDSDFVLKYNSRLTLRFLSVFLKIVGVISDVITCNHSNVWMSHCVWW
jgi:hypothetical protein